MKFKKPKLVCYDWDNTLVDTMPVTLVSMNLLYERYKLPRLSIGDIVKINGYCFSDVFTAVFGRDDSKAVQEEYQAIYDNYAENMLQPIPHSIETVKMIHDFGIPQAVMSNKPGYIVRREAEKFHFAEYFEFIVGPDDSGFAKPDQRMFNPVYEKMEFKDRWHHPDKLWFFGDAEADVDYAKAINARLFFLGDTSLVHNFSTDQLVILKGHSDMKNIEFYDEV